MSVDVKSRAREGLPKRRGGDEKRARMGGGGSTIAALADIAGTTNYLVLPGVLPCRGALLQKLE